MFLDPSALVKRYVEEPGSGRVADLLVSCSSLGISVIAPTEIVSALCRRRREGHLTQEQYRKAKQALFGDVSDIDVVALTDQVIARSVTILERWPLRASDSLHVACAAEWTCELFVSADDRQCKAAHSYGLRVERIPLA